MSLFGQILVKEDERFKVNRKKDRIEEFRDVLQFMFLLMIPVYMLFWLLDVIFAPHLKWFFLALRLPMIPLSIACYYITKRTHNLRGLQILGLILAIYVGFTVSIMTLMTGGVFSPYYAGLNLAAIASLCFFPWTITFKILGILAVFGLFYFGCFFFGLDSDGLHRLVIISWFTTGTVAFSLIIRFFHDLTRLKEIRTRLALHDEQQKLKEEQEKLKVANRLIREAFGRYLSDDIVESILKSPEGLSLGGKKLIATIMITDLRGFTPISEQFKPEQVVRLLNSYFKVMFEVVQEFNGTINEISGDSLLVLFGALQNLPDRNEKAVACAITMQNSMVHVNEGNREKGLPELEMGIGINDAEVIVGNVGSDVRSKYGVVGSGVNMTSRIQSYATGGQILVSESVRKDVGEILRIDDQMEVHPKGTEVPITIYRVGGIGGHYNVALEEKDVDLAVLKKEISISFTVLDEKHMSEHESKGKILRLSLQGCEVSLEKSIDPLSNIKMNLSDVKEDLASKDFYAKVEKGSCSDPSACRVRFTSLPPAVNGYFQAVLDRDMN